MKELIEQVIWLGNYDLAQLLETIDRYHVEGRLTCLLYTSDAADEL